MFTFQLDRDSKQTSVRVSDSDSFIGIVYFHYILIISN